MHASNKPQAQQHVVVSAQRAPTPISQELLQFIGGGKGVPTPTPSLPKGGW